MGALRNTETGGGDMHKDDRLLLDLLCAVHPREAQLDRVFRFRPGWGDVIHRLRMRGLVAFDALTPSPSALLDYTERESSGGDDPAGEAAAIEGAATASRTRLKPADWSAEEDARLRALYGKVPTAQLAEDLGRSKGGVHNRASALRLKHGYHRDWSEEERRAFEVAHRRGISLADLAVALGRKYDAVAKFSGSHGYSFGHRPRAAEPLTLQGILALADPSAAPPRMAKRPRPAKVRQPEEWPEERRQAFLATLERTGKIGEAIAAAGLARSSRRAAYRVKARDAHFSAQWDAALKVSPFKPGRKARPKPPEPLKPPQPGPWVSLERQRAFLEALGRHGSVRTALCDIGLSKGSWEAYRRARSRLPAFAAACDAAIAACRGERSGSAGRDGAGRKKLSRWDQAELRDRFVETVRSAGGILPALRELGLPPGAVKEVRKARDRYPDFGKACAEALQELQLGRSPRRSAPARQAAAGTQVARPAAMVGARPAPSGRLEPAAGPRSQIRPAPAPQDERCGRLSHGLGLRSPPPRSPTSFPLARRKSDAEISAEKLRYLEERKRIEACGRRDLDVEEAKLVLQRKGRSVYRASVIGGRSDRWAVSGLGSDVTDEQLVAAAEAVVQRSGAHG